MVAAQVLPFGTLERKAMFTIWDLELRTRDVISICVDMSIRRFFTIDYKLHAKFMFIFSFFALLLFIYYYNETNLYFTISSSTVRRLLG